MSMLKYLLTFLFASSCWAHTSAESSTTTSSEPEPAPSPLIIDALVLYSPGVLDLYDGDPSARIEHIFSTANTAYENSGLNTKLSLVDAQLHELDDSVSSTVILSLAINDEVLKEKRDEVGADVVILYRPMLKGDTCGITFMGGEASRSELAIAHIGIDCSSTVTVHELGHIMGLGHSHRQNSHGVTPYATGYGIDATFTTLMAYPTAFENAPTVLNFSSPDLLCSGMACGVPIDQVEPAYAVLALQSTQEIVANYREHKEVLKPVAVTPPTPLELAQQAYENYVIVHDEIRDELISAKKDLREKFSTQIKAFRKYLSARISHYKLKRSDDASDEELELAASNSAEAKVTYTEAKEARKVALVAFRSTWFDSYLPSLTMLTELRLEYLIEKMRAETPEPETETTS